MSSDEILWSSETGAGAVISLDLLAHPVPSQAGVASTAQGQEINQQNTTHPAMGTELSTTFTPF